jgi:SAM-dependent methyltransferase
VTLNSRVTACKRARWQGRANVERFAEQIKEGHGAQRLKNVVETGIVRRFIRGDRLLDVGIGTGRVSLPFVEEGLNLTGVDASAAMIERCGRDARAADVRLVTGELEHLPFAHEAFDTVMSVDTFTHFPDWAANLDELFRVTRFGGRIIVDVGSRDHVDAVAHCRGCTADEVEAAELGSADAYLLRVSCSQLRDYAAERDSVLVALVPYGAILGSLAPNYWIGESYAFRSGGIDRLVSWTGADPALFAFAEFIERRIVQRLPATASGRMFAVFERKADAPGYIKPLSMPSALFDERASEEWHAEFSAHVQHERSRAFAVAFLLAAWPLRLPVALRGGLPDVLLHELDRAERAEHIDDLCADVVAAWRLAAQYVAFHGVDLSDVFGTLLRGELRDRLEANE